MNYYISDLHIGHANVIRFDKRPFANLNEMHRTIIDNRNSRVKIGDTVYILGDLIWYKENEWQFIVPRLAALNAMLDLNNKENEICDDKIDKNDIFEITRDKNKYDSRITTFYANE